MVRGLVSIILLPQLECDVALRTRPDRVSVLDLEVNGILVSDHVSLLSKLFVTQVTRPGLHLQMLDLLVSDQNIVCSEVGITNITMKVSLFFIFVLISNMSSKIQDRLQAVGANFLDTFMNRLNVFFQTLS